MTTKVTRATAMRRKQILEFLTDNEGSARDVQDNLHIPYVTARRLLVDLEKDKKVKVSSYEHGTGGYKYRTISTDPMPYLQNFDTNLPAVTYLEEMAKRANMSGGRFVSQGVSDAVHLTAQSLAAILHNANLLAMDGKMDESEMREARNVLNKGERVFAEMAKLCRQILDNHTFWEPEMLIALTRSQHWNMQEVERSYNTLTTKMEQ